MLLTSAILAVSAVYVIAGVLSRRAQPRNRTGVLMVVVGLGWTADLLLDRPDDFIYHVAAKSWPAVLGHLVTAFPTGRLRTVPRRAVVISGYLFAVVLTAASYWPGRPWTPVLESAETPLTLLVGLAMLGLQLHRWRCSSMAQRRTLTSMLGASLVAVIAYTAWKPMTEAGLTQPIVALMLALVGIPFAYLAGLLRRRVDRAGLADLVVRLNADGPRAGVRDALAATLRDPGLRVAYWTPAQERYVDASGAPVEADENSVQTRVDRGSSRVAVLLHDPGLDLELVDAACAAVALALENERLAAELRARLRQLAESRRTLLRAGEVERRRLERDLHDGVQQRLLSVAMTLGLAETLPAERGRALVAEAKSAVLATIDDVRALCHGIHPPVLTERGLGGAVRELAALAGPGVELVVDIGTPLPPQVETTAYYVVAEALANVTKHAGASRTKIAVTSGGGSLVVRVDDDGRGGADVRGGSGLRGLTDRVEATGGTMKVVSTVETGTSVRVVLPCGS
ncbi:sensor histidine kinase [Actinosynnema sp. NPDC047251]|uniref:histidine kinase n=1 Tax=Saccharothrix espanaensis (strain ATCC 51144 / DSM 44229 / JCM 9112 / NBRC 15066 / NRRL 15764) TaxID=1179773 RepID=K0JQP1_SACES|nr:sensor histidine kinase [Saccharothrix espanaensis]CCH29755.1 putative secreted protein [Saccharothrix espanaensis DSM 44229]